MENMYPCKKNEYQPIHAVDHLLEDGKPADQLLPPMGLVDDVAVDDRRTTPYLTPETRFLSTNFCIDFNVY